MSFGLVKHNNNSISAITTPGSLSQGKMTLIKEQTASSSSSISFVDGSSNVVLDNTYPIYIFKFINIHASATGNFTFQGNAAGASGFNETMTTTIFRAQNDEGGTDTNLLYNPAGDQTNGTGKQELCENGVGNGNDESISGNLWIFNPSDTTFQTNFMAVNNMYQKDDYSNNNFIAGYFNLTGAIDEIIFDFSSGNIQSGTFKMYGIA